MTSYWLRVVMTLIGMGVTPFTALAQSDRGQIDPPSLFAPARSAHELTREDRWRLDFELANEASMKEHNSYRFDAPGSFEKRARWFAETARWYRIADLMQQLIDFRKGAVTNNEAAMTELHQLGQLGNEGAACIAWMFYRHHRREITENWKLSFEDVARGALRYQDSGHPVCVGIEGTFYIHGELGYPKDRLKARTGMVKSAGVGFYGAQRYMMGTHLSGAMELVPRDLALYLCWMKVAYAQAPIFSFPLECDVLKREASSKPWSGQSHTDGEASAAIHHWCNPSRTVKASDCANLENLDVNQ